MEIRRATNMFLGLDREVVARYEPGSTTRFVAVTNSSDEEYGEVIFSDDIYPGKSIASPNSALTLKSAAAHELAHYYRWLDKTELPHGHLTHIDEAMTSLEAVLRYGSELSETDLQGLISDSLQRLRLFLSELESKPDQAPI